MLSIVRPQRRHMPRASSREQEDVPLTRPAVGVLDVSLPPQRHSSWHTVLAWVEAVALAEMAGLAILAVGLSFAIAMWLVIEVGHWLFRFTW